jgi:hypothetical protein
LLALFGCALLCAVAAQADRYSRGYTVFQQKSCARCHSIGWQNAVATGRTNSTDLTQVVSRRNDTSLRAFLADPYAGNPTTGCDHRKLTALEIEDLVHFFHARAKPQPSVPLTQGGH